MAEKSRVAASPDRDVGGDVNTVRDYFQLYLEGGVEKLKEVMLYHPQRELDAHITSLEAYFRAHPPATIKEAQAEIGTLTGIKRIETQVREFLKKTASPLPQSRDDPGQS